jgi:hypothetical protein
MATDPRVQLAVPTAATDEWSSRCWCSPHDRKGGDTCNRCGIRWIPAVLTLGRVSTRNYLFEALGVDRADVEASLLAAYASHVAALPPGQADPNLMAEVLADDEVSWTELRLGQAAIDGEPV